MAFRGLHRRGSRLRCTSTICRSTALVAASEGSSGPDLLGGLLFGVKEPTHHVDWLLISEQARGKGVGRALMAGAMRQAVSGSSVVVNRVGR
ncbi:GNAT family N-acetyltransferase [Streptomyces sp. NPDC000994]